MTTAAEAYYGGCIVTAIAANYRLRLPYGPGGARSYQLNPDAAYDVTLPDARHVKTGAPIYWVHNKGASNLTVKDATGTSITIIAGGEAAHIGCIDNSTAAGSWYVFGYATVTVGTALTIGREPYTITLDGPAQNWNLRTHLNSRGYPGIDPVAVTLVVDADAVIGSAIDGTAALDTGEFPSGSTLLLLNRGLIVGKGGRGGRGGESGPFGDGPGDGYDGGVGLYCRMTTVIANLGTIAGGGGGGGGGTGDVSSSANPGGGGGGGGCGYLGGFGGEAPYSPGATGGNSGGLYYIAAGGTGYNAGGSGGALGSAGSAGGGSGGAAGAAGSSITRLSAYTVTKIRTGTIAGPEVAV